MRKLLILCLILIVTVTGVTGQPLTGIKNIPGSGGPNDFSTIKQAISALNANGVGIGGVIFEIASDFKESFTAPEAGYITTLTGSLNSPVIFRKSGSGANPLVTAALGIGSMDAIFLIAGCDYITFDGIDIRTNPDSFGPDDQAEWGFAILKAYGNDGSQHITIKNCLVLLDNSDTTTVGIYVNNHTAASMTPLTLTSASGTNSEIKIFGNTIQNSYNGIIVNGFQDTSPFLLYDQNNEIGKDGPNTIITGGGAHSVAYGIYTTCQNNLKVANNTVNGQYSGFKDVYGINLTTADNASFDLYGNTVTVQFNAGNPYMANLYGIYCNMGANGTSNTANVYNNTVTGCTLPYADQTVFYGLFLYNLGVTANVYGNTVSNNTYGSNGSPYGSRGQIRYMWVQKLSSIAGPLQVYNNQVTGNIRLQTVRTNGTTHILAASGSGTTLSMHDNLVSNNVTTAQDATHCLYNYFNDSNGKYIYNNTVSNITEANGSVVGLYNSHGTSGFIYSNKISGIHAAVNESYAFISGITQGNEGGHMFYYNNMVSDLTNPGATATLGMSYNSLAGINVEASAGVTKSFYHNTVYLNATATNSSEYGSAAFWTQRLSEIDLRNNIFINVSQSAGTNGKTVAIRSRETGVAGFTSNYNDLYAGIPGPANLIFSDGTNSKETLSAYQTFITPNELQSVSEMVPFVNSSTPPYDVHVQTGVPTVAESGGVQMTSPFEITTDIDSNSRYPNAGYPVNPSYPATAPDLGADEFGGIPKDLIGPQIIYIPLTSINNSNPRTLIATITDPSGVPTSGFGSPMLYWRKNNGAWAGVQGVFSGNDTYSFTFGAGTSLLDWVYYYIVAQDNLQPIPNISAYPPAGAAGFTANPPACTTPPAIPSSYQVISGISGVMHVGVGKDYITLTAAALDLNAKYMEGPVTFILDDEIYPNETLPIRFNERPGNSPTNTLTIKPNTGITPVIAGAASQNGILVMNGIDHVTVDGSNNGTNSRDLTIENSSSSAWAHAFGITNHDGTDPSTHITLKNCILMGTNEGYLMQNTVVLFNHNGGVSGGGYDHCLIANNTIKRSLYGINLLGSAGNLNRFVTISGNTIGSMTMSDAIARIGIEVTNCDNTIISDNEIIGPAEGTGHPFIGMNGIIFWSNCTNTKIHRNTIHDWYNLGSGSNGIKVSTDNSTTITEIFNNVIYNIKCWGFNPGVSNNLAYNIFIRRGSNIRMWHNSLYLNGPFLEGTGYSSASSACVGVYEAASNNLDLRDNIMRNAMTNPSNPPIGASYGRAYAIMFAGTQSTFNNLDYNDYFVDGYNGAIAQRWITGVGYGDEFNTLEQWQTYTGMEGHSLAVNPQFVSDTVPIDLHPTNLTLNSNGGPRILDDDCTGAIRYTPPDMGAYEWSALISDYHTLEAHDVTSSTATLRGDIDT